MMKHICLAMECFGKVSIGVATGLIHGFTDGLLEVPLMLLIIAGVVAQHHVRQYCESRQCLSHVFFCMFIYQQLQNFFLYYSRSKALFRIDKHI